MTPPTIAEQKAIDSFSTPNGGDLEDHVIALVVHLRRHGIKARPLAFRAADRSVSVAVKLPSGVVVAPRSALEADIRVDDTWTDCGRCGARFPTRSTCANHEGPG